MQKSCNRAPCVHLFARSETPYLSLIRRFLCICAFSTPKSFRSRKNEYKSFKKKLHKCTFLAFLIKHYLNCCPLLWTDASRSLSLLFRLYLSFPILSCSFFRSAALSYLEGVLLLVLLYKVFRLALLYMVVLLLFRLCLFFSFGGRSFLFLSCLSLPVLSLLPLCRSLLLI